MRLSLWLAAAGTVFFSLVSCDNPASPGSGAGSGYFVKCTVDGVAKNLTDQVFVEVQQGAANGPITLNVTGVSGSLTSATSAMATIFIPGTVLQTYNPGGPITWSEVPPGSVYSSVNLDDSSVHSQVTLTRCDPPGGTIEGTFLGTVYDTLGDSLQVTDGSFRVKRPQGADSGGLTLGTADTISLTYDGTTYVWKSKLPNGTLKDLVKCTEITADGKTATTILGSRVPGFYEMVQIEMLGPANGSYTLGNSDQGALTFPFRRPWSPTP